MPRVHRRPRAKAPASVGALLCLLLASCPDQAEARRKTQHDSDRTALLTTPQAAAPLNSASETFHAAVAAAWELLPQRQDLAARNAEAAARLASGRALFPNAPTANASYVNDRVAGSNNGYLTSQVEFSTPVWLPGEGTATQNTARADTAATEAAVEAAHLALAGDVLDLVTQATLAANARDAAARRLETSKALAADLDRRFEVGETAQADALAADADAESASVTFSTDEAQLAGAQAALGAVTGQEAIPRLDAPSSVVGLVDDQVGPGGEDPLAHHPRIIAAERELAAAEAKARLVAIENRDDPEIGVQAINEKQPGTRWDTRLGVTLKFSFATEARNAPRRAAAQRAITQAEVQLALARREVLTAQRQAALTLAGAERSSAAAARAAADLEIRRGQIERAWRLGEFPTIELVRANALASDADLTARRARTERDSARLRVMLAAGTVP